MINDLAETNFGKNLINKLSTIPSKLEYTPSGGAGKAFVVDKLFIKGMNVDRTKNDSNFDYYYVSKLEKHGLRQFIHKFNTGDIHYYYMRDMQKSHFAKIMDPVFKEQDPDGYYHFHRKV